MIVERGSFIKDASLRDVEENAGGSGDDPGVLNVGGKGSQVGK